MARKNTRPTIKQVAQLAGVSPMTVSKTLTNKMGVAASTRKMVQAAAKKLHYTPNELARSFRNSRSNTLGVIMADSFEEVFTTLFHGIESAAETAGFSLLLSNAHKDPEKEQAIIQLLVGRRMDGLIITSPMFFGGDQIKMLSDNRLPFVVTMRSHPNPLVPTVRSNNTRGAMDTIRYLAKTQSRHFLFLALDTMFTSSEERMAGWKAGLAEFGLGWNPEQVVYCQPSIEAGKQLMHQCLQGGHKFDTVVCGCDTIAIGAMEALLDSGVAIPDQVRITGFDDIPLAAHVRVPLTTVRQPLADIGKTGTELLLDYIDNPLAEPRQVILEGEFIVRAST